MGVIDTGTMGTTGIIGVMANSINSPNILLDFFSSFIHISYQRIALFFHRRSFNEFTFSFFNSSPLYKYCHWILLAEALALRELSLTTPRDNIERQHRERTLSQNIQSRRISNDNKSQALYRLSRTIF